MIWNKMFKGLPLLAAATIASACGLEVSGLLGAGGAPASGSSSVASAGPAGGGTSSSSAAESSSSSAADSSSSSGSSGGGGGGGGGGMGGGCTSPEDKKIAEDAKVVTPAAQSCGPDCFFFPDYFGCTKNCMMMKTKMSDTCGKCWADVLVCSRKGCLDDCQQSDSEECTDCTKSSCGEEYQTCAGLPLP